MYRTIGVHVNAAVGSQHFHQRTVLQIGLFHLQCAQKLLDQKIFKKIAWDYYYHQL